MTTRKGRPDDAAAIADIFNHYIATSEVIFSNRQRSVAETRQVLEGVLNGGYPFYVSVDDEGRVSGYCYAHAWQPDAVYGLTWEITIYLRHDATGHGIGSQLLRAVRADCRAAGAHTLIACVTHGNTACATMLQRAGFIHTGCIRQSGYKFGRFLDDDFYQLIL